MKKSLIGLVLAMLFVSADPATLQPQVAEAQWPVTCYAESITGTYYWTHLNPSYARARAMHVCQMNTPAYAACFFRGCE